MDRTTQLPDFLRSGVVKVFAVQPHSADYSDSAVWKVLSRVKDPEIPVISVVELGIVRQLNCDRSARHITVVITPTWTACPAFEVIVSDIETALHNAGYEQVTVKRQLLPAWTTDWVSAAGRNKLRKFGISPPPAGDEQDENLLLSCPACPHCGSANTKLHSEFGATLCKAHLQCNDCLEPFDHFKCLRSPDSGSGCGQNSN